MSRPKIGIIVGSNRATSINRQYASVLARLGGDRLDFRALQIDDLPLFNQDHERQPPTSVMRFKEALIGYDTLLFVTPEHNRSIPAVLKSALDWASRPPGQNAWAGKRAAITGATPGALGTALAQQHLRQVLTALGVLTMSGEVYLTLKPGLFADDGTVTDERTREFLSGFLDQLAALAAMRAPLTEVAA